MQECTRLWTTLQTLNSSPSIEVKNKCFSDLLAIAVNKKSAVLSRHAKKALEEHFDAKIEYKFK